MEAPIPQIDHGQALPAGTRIEEFMIERELGSGGFGITYLARDVRLDRYVVIKENLPVQFCFRVTHSLTVSIWCGDKSDGAKIGFVPGGPGRGWRSDAGYCRVSARSNDSPANSGHYPGFRVARSSVP